MMRHVSYSIESAHRLKLTEGMMIHSVGLLLSWIDRMCYWYQPQQIGVHCYSLWKAPLKSLSFDSVQASKWKSFHLHWCFWRENNSWRGYSNVGLNHQADTPKCWLHLFCKAMASIVGAGWTHWRQASIKCCDRIFVISQTTHLSSKLCKLYLCPCQWLAPLQLVSSLSHLESQSFSCD